MNLRTVGLGFIVFAALVAIAAAALNRFMPTRSTAYEGYSRTRLEQFKEGAGEQVFRYVRNCVKPGADPIVDQNWESTDDFGRERQLAYYAQSSNPRGGTTRESGIAGWQGLFTPPLLAAGVDTPPGEFSVCNYVNTDERSVLYPSALERADRNIVVPTTDDSIAWEARATTPEQALALATLWEEARDELGQKGPAWKENVERRVGEDGKESLESASVRYRGTDGSEVTLEFRRIESNPTVMAVLIAHKRLPKQPASAAAVDAPVVEEGALETESEPAPEPVQPHGQLAATAPAASAPQ